MTSILYKTDPNEVINVGDIIMLDVETGLVTVSKAPTKEDYYINNRLIVGICTDSDNITLLPIIIDCGNSKTKDEDTTLIDCGDSTAEPEQTIYGGDSVINPRQYITVSDTGVFTITTDGRPIEIGEQVIMSNEPNKVTSNMYDDFDKREWYYARTIGKVVKILGNNQVEVQLDVK